VRSTWSVVGAAVLQSHRSIPSPLLAINVLITGIDIAGCYALAKLEAFSWPEPLVPVTDSTRGVDGDSRASARDRA
jgi:hypothetical protein